jgi:hypothetical protein
MESEIPVQERFPLGRHHGRPWPRLAGLCDIVYDIVYDIEYNNTDMAYDIDIRYRIAINMENYGLVVSYVYIVPLFSLNCLL